MDYLDLFLLQLLTERLLLLLLDQFWLQDIAAYLNELSVSNHGWVFNNTVTLHVGIERTISVKSYQDSEFLCRADHMLTWYVGFNPTLDRVDDDCR